MDKYFHLFMNTITQFWGTVLSGLREIIIQDISNDYLFIYLFHPRCINLKRNSKKSHKTNHGQRRDRDSGLSPT